MKKSLNTKVLVLSLSAALVIVGSGCERRGRAPVKATASDDKSAGGVTDPSAQKPGDPTPPAPQSTVEVSDKEAELIADSKISSCDVRPYVRAIDEHGKVSKENFLADLDTLNGFLGCMESNGINLRLLNPETTRDWKLDTEKGGSTALEYAKLSASSNDDDAIRVMASRARLSAMVYGKFVTKYSDIRLKDAGLSAQTEVRNEKLQKSFTIGGTRADFVKSIEALTEGEKEIRAMKTVTLGYDESSSDLDPSAEVPAADLNASIQE